MRDEHEGLGRITPLQPNYISDILNDNSHIQKKINEIIAKVNILIELKNGELAGRPTPTALAVKTYEEAKS